VDGNDPVAMLAVMDAAREYVLAGNGPVIVEAHTYRVEGHTNADDPTRYRTNDEVAQWIERDPIDRLSTYLRAEGLIDDAYVDGLTAEAEDRAAALRTAMNSDRPADPDDMFRYVFANQTTQLIEQQMQARADVAADTEENCAQ
jgi:pyruvate dehydrogenase E1 component alpha subunit